MHWKTAGPVAAIAIAASLMLGCSGKDGSDDDNPVRVAAALATTKDNMISIGKALANYESVEAAFPLPAIRDKGGKPLLSWRVAILPYIEEQALYKQFKLDEPWDSPNNIKLLEKMPRLYEAPYLPETQRGHTYLQAFTGPKTVFPTDKNVLRGMKFAQLAAMDGLSTTVMAATAAKAVPWTKPEDIVVDAEAIKPKVHFGKRGAVILMADGSVWALSEKISEKTLRWAIDPNDGNPLPGDWLD